MTRLARLDLWLILTLLAVPIGCGGGSSPGSPDSDLGLDLAMPDIVDDLPPTEGTGGRDLADDETPATQSRYEIILLLDDTEAIPVQPSNSLKFRAMLKDYAQNAPGAGLYLHYEFVKVEDLSGNPASGFDGSFEALDIMTEADGVAVNWFRTCTDCTSIEAGKGCDLRYTIEVSLPDADPDAPPLAAPKTFEVLVPCAECGCANVRLSNETNLSMTELTDIDVYVLPSDYTCEVLSPGKPVPPRILADRNIAELTGQTTFDCLPEDSDYTFYALGHRGASPCVVAHGCREVTVKSGPCKDVTVKMFLATLNPTGVYDCIDHFDFSDLIEECAGDVSSPVDCITSAADVGKTICCALREIIRLFENPGETIINSVFDLLKLYFGSLIIDTVENALTILKNAVANIITDYLKNNSPPFVQDLFTMGEDLIEVFTNLEMLSTLTLSKMQANLTIPGTQSWTGLALYWKLGCDPAAPDYDQCGRFPLDLKDINDPNFPLTVLSGPLTASLVPFDQFQMFPHSIMLNYGKLVLYFIEDVFIKWATGGKANSILGVAKIWIDCAAIANSVIGDIAGVFGGKAADVEKVCNGAVDLIFGFTNSFLGALTLDSELRVSGLGTFVDVPKTDAGGQLGCDLEVDKIINGRYEGTIQSSQATARITGTFECTKVPDGAARR